MANTRSATFFSTLVLCLLCVTLSRSEAQAFKWDPVKHNGVNYVTLSNVKAFYGFDKLTLGRKISLENKSVRIELGSGSQQCRMNGVLFILSHPIVPKGGKYLISRTDLVKLIDPVMRPAYISTAKVFKTVVLDPGHGGHDSGAKGPFKNEKEYALNVARLLRDILQKKGYRVVMTRDSDVFITLGNRVRIANKYKDAIFISIHFNAANSRAHGIETFTVSPVGVPHIGRGVKARDFNMVPGNIMDSASIALATAVHSRSLLYLNNPKGNNFKMSDRGIKRARFNVLTGIKIPAILVEGGFLSNRAEATKINSPVYQQTLAAAVARAVDVYKNSIMQQRRR
ncbi:N-acetylmuramoyl-L-alanine amidase [Verrucomicrobiaceae bacterium 5K15]|uniref:N-acetylmuramoyl-L-alanine amidase n=1 Tax=Oceaniferula flava TaxID=2800421 RepID=A0AAE2SAY2_9BACT|nr:N-acetylmuramoyl-L-alanine amidase [Oceaniferula flavus]MBK1855078.1 N-acetylmuramoyl-L-alanine amidase [Oceaniferula flavus]MBM1136384.1 N-acetylmuramoyl-L-alanine amidase [Oceaniferula flavus]